VSPCPVVAVHDDPSPLRLDKDRMLRSTIALAAVAVTYHLFVCVGAVVPAGEHGALVDMYNALDGPLWSNASGWGTDSASDPCAAGWFGVACNVDGSHVVGMYVRCLLGGLLRQPPALTRKLHRHGCLTPRPPDDPPPSPTPHPRRPHARATVTSYPTG
jgi:hypothetical protein